MKTYYLPELVRLDDPELKDAGLELYRERSVEGRTLTIYGGQLASSQGPSRYYLAMPKGVTVVVQSAYPTITESFWCDVMFVGKPIFGTLEASELRKILPPNDLDDEELVRRFDIVLNDTRIHFPGITVSSSSGEVREYYGLDIDKQDKETKNV